MFGFLVMLGVVYVAGAYWPKLVSSGAAPVAWEWPVGLVAKGWYKLFGKDSVFDKKED